jgi:hypothetical protein
MQTSSVASENCSFMAASLPPAQRKSPPLHIDESYQTPARRLAKTLDDARCTLQEVGMLSKKAFGIIVGFESLYVRPCFRPACAGPTVVRRIILALLSRKCDDPVATSSDDSHDCVLD